LGFVAGKMVSSFGASPPDPRRQVNDGDIRCLRPDLANDPLTINGLTFSQHGSCDARKCVEHVERFDRRVRGQYVELCTFHHELTDGERVVRFRLGDEQGRTLHGGFIKEGFSSGFVALEGGVGVYWHTAAMSDNGYYVKYEVWPVILRLL
jgi:hypothetical protein